MFIIDKNNNTATEVAPQTFAGLGFRERDHLQEWIRKNPIMLGEDLLIIQKEFAGFEGTSMRLDLLALDKKGNLVIIENKRDDSGKDVTGQALKYASFFSTATQQKIVQIFQEYLDAHFTDKDAEKELCEFFGTQAFSDIPLLNEEDRQHDRYQRIILVAAAFQPEVTSTVMWLLKHKVKIQCIQTTLYKHGENIFIDTEQIIPGKAVEEYQGKLAEKRQQDKRAVSESQRQYDASQISFLDNYDAFRIMVDEACDLLSQQSGGKLSKKRTDGGKRSWYYVHRITGFDWGTCCFGYNHNEWKRLSEHGITSEHFFVFSLSKLDAKDTDYETLSQEVLERCGFVYAHKSEGWWIYNRSLELDKDDITPQKIADAVKKIADEITEAYHKAKQT